ncbi:MAG: ABC transporter permease [Spirochaetia bacterium]|jgi:peptide/nickel transport system permease protein|nr:ABC transporter permease [Spirochaetia bacterium]
MTVFIVRRLIQSILLILIMSVIVFFSIYAIGNPVDVLVPPDATQAEKDLVVKQFGLDRPIWEQYGRFLLNALKGDMGKSFRYNEPALKLIIERAPATLELAFSALLITIVVGIPLGILAGYRPNALSSKFIMAGSIFGFSVPTFWLGLMLIMVFAVILGWLPAGGRGQTVDLFGIPVSFLTLNGLKHLILPALNLAAFKSSLILRLTRAGVREAVLTDYVKYARAKGISGSRIVLVHVLKNIMIPIVTVLGLEFGRTIAFAVVTESIFAWPGMGKLIIDSIAMLDRPVIVAYLMVIVSMFIVINLVVDILYSFLDPRVRLQELRQ